MRKGYVNAVEAGKGTERSPGSAAQMLLIETFKAAQEVKAPEFVGL